ncbi:hypothetical protein PGIGA_G00111130 [Pangasianodon gigas]|uniref:Uncharacterized protein n=1 Tax=Pangasianodon gigas TaxID=30993 RepID=A0ACC5W914_PANGG|nr:hypothetical protein [Pangasianodon gigas]
MCFVHTGIQVVRCLSSSFALSAGLKKRTRKAFGIRKKEKDTDSTGSPDREGGPQKKSNGAPNGFYGEIDWDRYNSPMVDEEGYSIRPDEDGDILTCTYAI